MAGGKSNLGEGRGEGESGRGVWVGEGGGEAVMSSAGYEPQRVRLVLMHCGSERGGRGGGRDELRAPGTSSLVALGSSRSAVRSVQCAGGAGRRRRWRWSKAADGEDKGQLLGDKERDREREKESRRPGLAPVLCAAGLSAAQSANGVIHTAERAVFTRYTVHGCDAATLRLDHNHTAAAVFVSRVPCTLAMFVSLRDLDPRRWRGSPAHRVAQPACPPTLATAPVPRPSLTSLRRSRPVRGAGGES